MSLDAFRLAGGFLILLIALNLISGGKRARRTTARTRNRSITRNRKIPRSIR
ncbi:MarC family protein [Roseibium salinum]|nr:MarC family protein [Roseibium salinum]